MVFLKLSTNRTLSMNKVTIEGDTLTINIKDATNDSNAMGVTEAEDSFSLSDLIAKYSQDHGCIALLPKDMTSREVSKFVALETTQLSLPEKTVSGNSYSSEVTTPGKHLSGSPYNVISGRYSSYGYVYILTPTINCAVEDLIIIYRDTGSADVTVDGQSVVNTATAIESTKLFLDSWMPVAINGPLTIKTGEKNTYTVTSTAGTTIYLESNIGIINRSRVVSGKSFVLDAYGLEPGEVITVKAGYKYWHGVSTLDVIVE
jgi:hypothetical protein